MYVGRIVAVGRTRGGSNAALYRVSSRSFPNRHVVEVEGRLAVVPREGHESDIQRNPYIAYNCARTVRSGSEDWAIVSNGSQTDPIAEKVAAGTPIRDALVLALCALDYEKDDYRTPRIAGAIPLEGDAGWLAVVRHDALVVKSVPLRAGRARWIATYEANDVRDEQEAELDAVDAGELARFAVHGGEFAKLTHPVTSGAVLVQEGRFTRATYVV